MCSAVLQFYLLSDSRACGWIAPRLPGVVRAASRALVRQDVELHVGRHATVVAKDPYLNENAGTRLNAASSTEKQPRGEADRDRGGAFCSEETSASLPSSSDRSLASGTLQPEGMKRFTWTGLVPEVAG